MAPLQQVLLFRQFPLHGQHVNGFRGMDNIFSSKKAMIYFRNCQELPLKHVDNASKIGLPPDISLVCESKEATAISNMYYSQQSHYQACQLK